ncbi:MAG TPA: LysM domain-containing protein [Arthrobacter sp.]
MKKLDTSFGLSKLKCGLRSAFRIATISGTIVLSVSMSACAPPSATPAPESVAMVQEVQQDPTATAAATASDAPAPDASAPAAATEAPAPEAPVPAEAPSNDYSVQSGDTVDTIAAAHGVDTYGMLAANGLGIYSVIVPGQVLKLAGPAISVPAYTPAPESAPAPAGRAAAPAPVAAAPAGRTIYVAGSGGQGMVDRCIGPIHFTPDDAWSLFIVEHDSCGGWARFSGIGVGETVTIAGYGTYTVTGRGQVPNPGTTGNVVAALGSMPRAVLQTCIPGTNQMLVIGLN